MDWNPLGGAHNQMSTVKHKLFAGLFLAAWAVTTLCPGTSGGQSITPSAKGYWKNAIAFEEDPFYSFGTVRWIKFVILLEPYDPSLVYYLHSKAYAFHYDGAVAELDPFAGMTPHEFNAISLFKEGQQAILGTVIVPPKSAVTGKPEIAEYGIQFVRQDPFSREEIRDMLNLVRDSVIAESEVQPFYFPTFELQTTAKENQAWFAAEGIELGSTARWAKGNTCYAEGWAMGRVKFVPATQIEEAYQTGELQPSDILLTDGIPAEVPFVAGILSLAPSTPNSHVAILAKTYNVPFVHLVELPDRERAWALEGQRTLYSAYLDVYGTCDVRMIDTTNTLSEDLAADILSLKEVEPLSFAPMASLGVYGLSTLGLNPSDIQYTGGKAAHAGILREALPTHSPQSIALTFDVWNSFLDQTLAPVEDLIILPGDHLILWADNDPEQGVRHLGFRLSKKGESILLHDRDGTSLLDSLAFSAQETDTSFGRSPDGSDDWAAMATPTPGRPNGDNPQGGLPGLVINEFMADNKTALEDLGNPGTHPDWIELYNGTDEPIVLNGMFLSDDVNDPTRWQIPLSIAGGSLREEIGRRLMPYDTYPPAEMQALIADLASIRSLFIGGDSTVFSEELRAGLLSVLTDPATGFNPRAKLRFRSSTNVEDSDDFVGAGLYASFSGCLAISVAPQDDGLIGCDPNDGTQRTVFGAIRRTFSSFYNDNAYLERLRHRVPESEVGMALLVHHSFPDEIELANGVATLEQRADGRRFINLVTQLGAVSVTNPDDGSIPEEVVVEVTSSGIGRPEFIRSSSLLAIGRQVMTWEARASVPDDYKALRDLLIRVSDQFGVTTGKTSYTLDLEYKKMAPGGETLPEGGLVVKQVRQIPRPDESERQTPFLINSPTEYEIFTGEVELEEEVDVFAHHRLKSRWTLETDNRALDGDSLDGTLYGRVTIEYLDEDRIVQVSEAMAQLPSAAHSVYDDKTVDSWVIPGLGTARSYLLSTSEVPTSVAATENPIVILKDLGTHAFNLSLKCLTLDVQYEGYVTAMQQSFESTHTLGQTTRNRVYLWPRDAAPKKDDIEQSRTLSADGISIQSSFYYPAPPGGEGSWVGAAGATAPLKRWGETVIEGLTETPIVLKGYYSQTMHPEHHNFVEHFLFEPRLEPGMSEVTLNQLESLDVRLIYMLIDHQSNRSDIWTFGFETQ